MVQAVIGSDLEALECEVCTPLQVRSPDSSPSSGKSAQLVRRLAGSCAMRLSDTGRDRMDCDFQEDSMDVRIDISKDVLAQQSPSGNEAKERGAPGTAEECATNDKSLPTLAVDQAVFAELTEPDEESPEPLDTQTQGEMDTTKTCPKRSSSLNRPSFSRASFTQLRAPKPSVENGRISFQGFQGRDGGTFVTGAVSGALCDGSSVKRISFSQMRRDANGDDDFGGGNSTSQGLKLTGSSFNREGIFRGSSLGTGCTAGGVARRSVTSEVTSNDLPGPSLGDGSSSSTAPGASMFSDEVFRGISNSECEIPTSLPARGTWQGTGTGSSPLVRSSIKRNTLRSLQREKTVGQSSLVSSMGETDSDLWANLPAIGKKGNGAARSHVADADPADDDSPVAASAGATADPRQDEASPLASLGAQEPSTPLIVAKGASATPRLVPESAASVVDAVRDEGAIVFRGAVANVSSEVSSRRQVQRSHVNSVGDEDFLQELAKVAEEDLECELPKVAAARFDEKDSLVLQLAQAVQSTKEWQEAAEIRNLQLLGRLAALEAENRCLREVAMGIEEEFASLRRELVELRDQRAKA